MADPAGRGGALVAVDHGPALRHLGVRRRAFLAETIRLSAPLAASFTSAPARTPTRV
ncbi:hypothetical protein ACFXPW_09495 [Streptomyces goshikiensis]|uniref:hypothetical protein n=1 Tax=Streptomyces goshikiensis TaxID=1942 RepID=UPI0036B01118